MSTEEELANRVARRALRGDQSSRAKTAGEVRFVTDKPGDSERQIDEVEDFEYDSTQLKKLSKVLWSLSCSLGHLISAHSDFTKLKAVDISPDGKLGGKGYVQAIPDMRTDLTECIETMSSVVDTIDDEVKAPHWHEDLSELTDQEQEEIDETLDDAQEVRESPEDFVDEEYEEEVVEDVEENS